MCFCFKWMKNNLATATDAEHKCACVDKQIWLQSKTEKKGKKDWEMINPITDDHMITYI